VPDNAAFCPDCGQVARPIERAQGKVGGLPETVAGALAYCTIIPAIVFLLVEPYSRIALCASIPSNVSAYGWLPS
jgi:hypothetical protein